MPKPPPSLIDPGAEAALLGLFMRDPRRLDDRRVRRALFASPPHPLIFDALRAAHDHGDLAGDLLTASAAVERIPSLPMPRSFCADAYEAADCVLPDALLTHVSALARRRQLRQLASGLSAVADYPHPDDDPETIATLAARTHELRNGDRPDTTCALESVQTETVQWLWTNRIPFSKLTILDGDPGLGKTALTLDLAARVSRGFPFPDDPNAPWNAANVLLVNAEDGLGDTLRPRLEAAQADLRRCRAFPLDQIPILPDDIAALQHAITLHAAALVIIDPLMAVLAPSIDAYKDQSVRLVLRTLATVAEATHAAILVVRHLTKQTGPKALYRGGGSIAFSAAARSALLLAADPDLPDDHRILAPVKHNLCAKPNALRFARRPSGQTLRLDFLGASPLTADDLVAPPPTHASEPIKAAMDFLRSLLKHGPVESDAALTQARAQGISHYALTAARTRLNVHTEKSGFSDSSWSISLPPDDPPAP